MKKHDISVVTGGTGFVGSHLVDYLLSEGHKVRCIVRKSSNLKWLQNKPIEIFVTGLFDKDKLRDVLKGVDYLFHVAGVVKAKKPEGYFKGNVETTRNLLEVVKEVNPNIKRILVVSSQTACGPSLDGKHCNEETKPHPITTYGRSKFAQEELAKSYMNELPITIVRPPAVYGERDTEIYLFFKTYLKGLMSMIGFNDKLVSIIHVADLVKGIFLAATSPAAEGQTYFISSEKYYNWSQIGDAIERATGKKAFRLRLPHFIVYTVAAFAQFFAMFSKSAATFNLEKAKDWVQDSWTCDVSKAVKEIGFHQEASLEEGIKRTIGWYKAMNWL
ncbi:MAG: nucleoside-diphosphate sugar epimerase [Ignavibacteria bacterium RBG_13_36_8]|nr:MAG: nucleoside-diphosphate sugar epimerase [Ignavibacteria bacterium RBG_13_36_8]